MRQSRPNLLGRGMLERARATSLALLGATTAVGLAIVAIGLNQEWPLISASPIPPTHPRHQSVGKATIAAGAGAGGEHARPAVSEGRTRDVNAKTARRGATTAGGEAASGRDAGSASSHSTEFVVAPAEPINSGEGRAHQPSHGHGAPSGTTHAPAQQPSPTPVSQPPAEPAPEVTPPPSSATATAAPTPQPATASGVPAEDESSVPSWSHGNGHAYGRDGRGDDDHGSHSYGHGHD